MTPTLHNPERTPLLRSVKGELCQDCLIWRNLEVVLDPLHGCPRCDAPTEPEHFSSDSAVMREALGIGGK